MVETNDLRAALQYIPQFRGQIFCVLIEAGLLPEPAVAETLLDLAALEKVGVKLVLGVLGGDLQDLYDWTLECEIKAARVRVGICDPHAAKEASEILGRGQSAIIDASGVSPLDDEVIFFGNTVGVSKIIALLEESILVNGKPAHAIRAADVPDVIQNESVEGTDLLLAAAKACHDGIPRVHVLNGRQQGVLVDELFSNEGVGTMVHADSYRVIRELREDDIPELLGMIGRVVRRTTLVARTYEDIESQLEDYHVMTIDGNVVGCVALHQYDSQNTAEVACLYVKQSHEGRGYGVELLKHAEEVAKTKSITKTFALTNRSADFFKRAGYIQTGSESLPPKRLKQFISSGRDSLVFEKSV
ncbi:MAG: GNAT family N-acetyltransferase [Akkermansiaceae bacterium]